MISDVNDKDLEAEFDLLADDYYVQHTSNIAITGEEPEYFSKYKIADFAEYFKGKDMPNIILDFGSGIGNSIPFFREYFPHCELFCGDISTRSMDIDYTCFPGNEKYITIQDTIPSEEQLFDAIFTACVFHHISHDFHEKWLKELFRVIKPGGVLAVYEHNPLNPLTVRAVNTCPIDVNARLIRAGNMKKLLIDCGWRDVRVEYKVFFPSVLKHLRFLEKRMNVLPLGAQYRLTAIR